MYVHAAALGALAAYNAKLLPDVERPVEHIPYGWQVQNSTEHYVSTPTTQQLLLTARSCMCLVIMSVL